MKKFLFFLLLHSYLINAQQLTPGFNANEYLDLLHLLAQKSETLTKDSIPVPKSYQLRYQSPVLGFDNQWSLWQNDNNQVAITIRGSVSSKISWLSNTYAALIPANGVLKLSKDLDYKYSLSNNPEAAVHAGWTMSIGFLLPDIRSKIDSCYQKGVRDFYITGHSQGGAISYLLTSQLLYDQTAGNIPADVRFKTYASAAPKPGNLFYAYDYEKLTQDGWAFNVVNPLDWVPEMPFSIQTTEDFNPLNPFPLIEDMIHQQSLVKKIVLHHFYNKIDKPSKRSQQKMQALLGKKAFKLIKIERPELEEPIYASTSNYTRAGATRVLIPDNAYFTRFPQDEKKPFTNHDFRAYLYLAEQLYLNTK